MTLGSAARLGHDVPVKTLATIPPASGGDSEATRDWPRTRRPSWLGAIGVLSDGPRLLVVRRAESVRSPGAWCFPGGALEAGETSREAVRRELREELSVTVEPRAPLGRVRVPGHRWVLAAWDVRVVAGDVQPDPGEVQDVRWLTPAEILDLQGGLPSNARVLELWQRRRGRP